MKPREKSYKEKWKAHELEELYFTKPVPVEIKYRRAVNIKHKIKFSMSALISNGINIQKIEALLQT